MSRDWVFYCVGWGRVQQLGKLECSVSGTWQLEVLGEGPGHSRGSRGLQSWEVGSLHWNQTMWLMTLWNWFSGGTWNRLELWAAEALQYCKQFKGLLSREIRRWMFQYKCRQEDWLLRRCQRRTRTLLSPFVLQCSCGRREPDISTCQQNSAELSTWCWLCMHENASRKG